MAQVMNARVLDLGDFLDAAPEASDFLHGLPRHIPRKQPRITLWDKQQPFAHNRSHIRRYRHPVNLALLRGRGRLRPDPEVQIELFKPRLTNFTDTRACQHAQADDPGRTLIFVRIQCGGHTVDFLFRQKPLPRRLNTTVEAICRVVLPHAPINRQIEHLAQHFTNTVRSDRRSLRALQLAGPIVRFGLVRPRSPFGDLGQKPIDVGFGDLRHQLLSPMWRHQFFQHRFMICGTCRGKPNSMLFEVSINQILHAWNRPLHVPFSQGVLPEVNRTP